MNTKNLQHQVHIVGNILGLLAICFILLMAFYFQFTEPNVLPCPLCYLQRIGITSIGVAMCLNLTRGPKTTHYGFIILSAIFTLVTATRQTLLHIIPGDPGYASIFWGKHTYSWNVITSLIIIIFVGLALLFRKGFIYEKHTFLNISKIIIILFIIIILGNFLSSFLECGFSVCPDNPTSYKYI